MASKIARSPKDESVRLRNGNLHYVRAAFASASTIRTNMTALEAGLMEREHTI